MLLAPVLNLISDAKKKEKKKHSLNYYLSIMSSICTYKYLHMHLQNIHSY